MTSERSGESQSTDDERWLVIDGRRWRRTDPSLPAELVDALKSHLGSARAEVGSAKRAGDATRVSAARHRVGLAKQGLGERGPKWWDEPRDARLDRAHGALEALDAASATTTSGVTPATTPAPEAAGDATVDHPSATASEPTADAPDPPDAPTARGR